MTDTPQNPPPGYYPDGSGGQRYWDGNAWTDQTAPAAPTAPAAATATMSNPKADAKAAKAYAKATRPWFKKKRWWAAIILLVLILAAALGGGGDDDGPELVDSEGNAAPASDSDEDSSDGPGSKSNPIAVGETVKLEGTQYTVTSARTAESVGGEFFSEEANGIYILVELTIENKKDETKTFLDSAANVIGANGKSYSTDSDGTFAAIGDDGEPLIFEDMQPDLPKSGLLVYDVPKDSVKGSLLEVSDLFGKGSAYIDLGL